MKYTRGDLGNTAEQNLTTEAGEAKLNIKQTRQETTKIRQEVTEHGNRNTDLMQRQKRETNNETRHASYRRQAKQRD